MYVRSQKLLITFYVIGVVGDFNAIMVFGGNHYTESESQHSP